MRAATARSPLLAILAITVIPMLSHLTIVATSAIRLSFHPSLDGLFKLSVVTISALTHWGIYASLLAGFALTLRPGREPLITCMARRLHGGLDAELAAYTRKVTISWSLFFASQLTL